MARCPYSLPTATPARRALRKGIAVRAPQSGVVLLIALVAVFMLMLAGLATMRSVGTTTLLSGNLAFREATVQSADYGLEAARAWLMQASPSSLINDAAPTTGYNSSWNDNFNPRNYDWNNSRTVAGPADFQVQYVIHRMCRTPNDAITDPGSPTSLPQVCYTASITGSLGQSNAQGVDYASSNPANSGSATPYYRITARVVGPRNAESFVQAMVY